MSLTTLAPTSTREVLARLVQLLAEEAPAAELDELAAAVHATAPPQAREALLRAVERSRRIRDVLERRTRRERETQALYETARDLTSLRDVDEVLHTIVHRVRRLLGSDSTYIALVDDETGDAYMRVTSGTVTPAIESVRQRPGYGVGGYVIQTGQPLATSNYLVDPRIRLDPSVASAVSQDGVVSIAGVPMKLGQRVIGALFAANRRERTFEQSEIALLTSLADHASVVIENARLYERVRAATRDLQEVNERLSAQRRALEQASAAHEQLMPLALTRADLGELTRTLARILDGTVALVDGDGAMLATASGSGPGAGSPNPTGSGTAAVPVRAGTEMFGHLLLCRREPLTDADARTLERAAQTAALLLLMERQTSIVADELRAELVGDLLAERPPDWEVFRRRAQRSGVFDEDVPHTVVVVSCSQVPRRQLLGAAAELARRCGGLAGDQAGEVVLLLPGLDGAVAARTAREELGRAVHGRVTAGAAGPATGHAAVRALHHGAGRCHRLLLALGREGDGADLEEFGVVGQVLESATPGHVRGLVQRTLGPLLAHDAEHAAPLVETLERYFATGRNPPATARGLGLHVNTVYQRLERIDQVLGGRGWREPQGVLELQMALQFHRLLGPAHAA
jgi:hypothetical protein